LPLVPINGTGIHYRLESASGEPLVLVHGSWGDHHSWDRVFPHLTNSFRVLSYDRRGHSQSERPNTQGSVDEDASDLAGLIEHLALAPAHILGNSFGGSIALRLATQRPDLFLSLTVHEPPLFGLMDDPESKDTLEIGNRRTGAVVDLLEKGEAEAGARLFMETIAFGPGSWIRFTKQNRKLFTDNAPTFLDEMRDPDWLSLDLNGLSNFSPATLLSAGDRSGPFFPTIVARIAGALPNVQLKTLEGMGHVPHLSHAKQYAEFITSFLRHVGTAN
jgi:pimeloyl-ACP methyl ester carboxylesterase